ncbi:MAG: hypothetical protein F4Y02_03185 [Chloroflexi bacterium]|nr:hypothetical protein [Chloroflexota bacterium]
MAIKVADAVWVATALLHRAYPDRADFSVAEIVARVAEESAAGAEAHAPSVQAHASVHCVAGKKPQPNRMKMLTETSRGRRRLYRPGDPCHPGRHSGTSLPDWNALPPTYRNLLDWYRHDYLALAPDVTDEPEYSLREADIAWPIAVDPILALAGSGREIWADEDADAYVSRLREGWD